MDIVSIAYLKKLAKRRTELYMSVRTLSLLSGVSESTIRRYEKGNFKQIRSHRLIALMRALGVPHMDYAYFLKEFKAKSKSIQEE